MKNDFTAHFADAERSADASVVPDFKASLQTQLREIEHTISSLADDDARRQAILELKRFEAHLVAHLLGADQSGVIHERAGEPELLGGALAEERHLLRALIDNLPDYIFVKDRESRFVINNKAHIRVLGADSQDEVVGKTDFDIFPQELAEQYYADEQAVIQSGQPVIGREEYTIDPQGRNQWLSTTKAPLRDSRGEVVGLVGISRDITERRQAEAQLEQRSAQLQTAAEVSRAATSFLDPEELIQQVVNLVRERFDLYYAGLFLVDRTGEWTGEPGKWAILRAGTGEAGRRMVGAGHKLEIGGSSMIGWCVANVQARIALDVGEEAVRFDNPWLPETHSEMALPLISRGQVIGAMTIQSTDEAAFSDEDIAVLQTMADQLAIAVENTRLYEQARTRAEREQLVRAITDQVHRGTDTEAIMRITVRELGQMLGASKSIVCLGTREELLSNSAVAARSYVWIGDEEGPNPGAWLPAMASAVQQAGSVTDTEQDGQTLAVPLHLGGEVIGALGFCREEARSWDGGEIAVVEVVAEQVALAVENQRLFEKQAQRADELATLNQIVASVNRSRDLQDLLEAVLATTLTSLGYDAGLISLVDEVTGHLYVASHRGLPDPIIRLFEQKGLIGTLCDVVFQTGETLGIGDIRQGAPTDVSSLIENGFFAYVGTPLVYQAKALGTMCLFSHTSRDLSAEQLSLLEAIGHQIGVGAENARLLGETQKALQEVEATHRQYLRQEWQSFLASRHDVEHVGYVLTRDGLKPISQVESPDMDLAVQSQQKVVVTDADEAPIPGQMGDGEGDDLKARSSLITPITLRGQVIGALDVFDPDQPREWTDDDLALVDAVTSQVAVAVENARLFGQTQAALSETEALYRASHRVTTSADLPALYQILVDEMAKRLGADQCQLTVFDREKGYGEIAAEYPPTPDLDKIRIPIVDCPAYLFLRDTRKPVALEDVNAHPALLNCREALARMKAKSMLLVPILVRGELVGSLEIAYSVRKRTFSAAELDFCQTLAGQAAITIDNMRAFNEIQRRANEMGMLFNVSRSLAGAPLESEEIGTIVSRQFMALMGVPECSISLYDPSDDTMSILVDFLKVGEDYTDRRDHADSFHLSDYPATARVMKSLQPLVVQVSDPGADPAELAYMRKQGVATLTIIPLAIKGQAIGVIELESLEKERHYTPEELNLAVTLANQAAVALENARLYEEQRHTAERLREMDQLKTQFLANMSHELRTPLNSIIGFSRVILKGIDGPLTEMQESDVSAIYNSGQHLLGLINDILDLSKIEAGKMELNFEEVDLKPIIKGVMSSVVGLVKDKPIELEQYVPDDLPNIWADATRIRQVLLNLVSNATKFTEEGKISLKADCDGNCIVINVTDTGVGIPEEKLENIFEEFTQVDGSTTRGVGGTGLGLPISRHFIEMHGGEIIVKSELGVGSTFTVTMPIYAQQEPETEVVEGQLAEGASTGERRLVLTVDDDPGVISLYRRYLESEGYRVVGVTNSDEVINKVTELQPYAVTLDVLMPNKDGWQVLQELKACQQTQHIPIIICSIVSNAGLGFSLGAADYLVKPIMEQELLAALSRLSQQEEEEAQVEVLVIDDRADDILLIRRMLESQHRYHVIEADGGQSGIDLVHQRKPHIIILDLMMPEVDGFAVLEALKREPDTRDIPVLVITAKELTEEQQQQLSGQVEVLLRKGLFSEQELLDDLGNALSEWNHSSPTRSVL